MKKLFVLFIIVLFAAPAMAVDWNFYGSARMATYWTDTDLGDGQTAAGDDDDANLLWQLQSNSRVGAVTSAILVPGSTRVPSATSEVNSLAASPQTVSTTAATTGSPATTPGARAPKVAVLR